MAVVDTNNLIRQWLGTTDQVCGGQFQEYKKNLLNFAKSLTGKLGRDIGTTSGTKKIYAPLDLSL